MTSARLILREARLELGMGLRSGIVLLVLVGLIAYLLMALVNAEYMQEMGATEIPRNAPSLIYLMASGCMFFLFFAWAWVFARPILRDRDAQMQEIVLATPNSLAALLWGRYIGATLVGALLAASVILGFLITPLLEAWGWLPAGAIAPTPWGAMLFAWLWLLVPSCVGIGAVYFLTTLLTRSLGGALGLSAALMLLWMFAVIVLEGGHIRPELAAFLDPSLFTFAHAQTETWTPHQKSTALLPLTPGSVLNRLFWGLLPLMTLAWYLKRVQRESLLLTPARPVEAKATRLPNRIRSQYLPVPIPAPRWWRALLSETAWQLTRVLSSRAAWVGVVVLLAMGVLSALVHIVWHAEGPMVPRPDLLLPLLKDAVLLVIAFVVAGLAGIISRRDQVPGVADLLDAAPAPSYLRLLGRALTILIATLVLALVPGASSLLVTALAAPNALDPALTLVYQAWVLAPPLLELALLMLLIHALIRRPGVAYTASMLVTFFLVLNHELRLVSYPPHEVGIGARINLSALTAWAPWQGYTAALAGFKLALGALLVALAAVVLPRGLDSRLRRPLGLMRGRLAGPVGALALFAMLTLGGLGVLLTYKLIGEGDYRSAEQVKAQDADWERRWLAGAGAFSVAGGALRLAIDPSRGSVTGTWRLDGVRAEQGLLHAETPHGFVLREARVDGDPVAGHTANDHLTLPLGACAATGCTVDLAWALEPRGWSAAGEPPWLTRDALWLRAREAMPRLGLDPNRVLRAPADRARFGLEPAFALPASSAAVASDAVAPAGRWQWRVEIAAVGPSAGLGGVTDGPLEFATVWASPGNRRIRWTEGADLTIVHDHSRGDTAIEAAEDLTAMRQCVERRLGVRIAINWLVQWPRGLGSSRLDAGVLQLAEAPSWDIADAGVGRWLRRAEIARVLARRHLESRADLRAGAGAPWLTEGVAGAVGLLCVAEEDGVEALGQVMTRYAEATTQGLATSQVPVATLASALPQGWAAHYAPLAALGWTLQQAPPELAALLDAVRHHGDLDSALTERAGPLAARALLGPPKASRLVLDRGGEHLRIAATRERWQDGKWLLAPADSPLLMLARRGRTLCYAQTVEITAGSSADSVALLLDAWPAYPRVPVQDLVLSVGPVASGWRPVMSNARSDGEDCPDDSGHPVADIGPTPVLSGTRR